MEAKFGAITEMYRDYCRANKLSMWVTEINRESIVWPQSSACPIGKWNKGSASTTMMLFLGWFAENHIKGHTEDELLLLIAAMLFLCYHCIFLLCLMNTHQKQFISYEGLSLCHLRLMQPYR